MTPRTRLALIAGLIILSAGYAVLVKRDPTTAAAVASGYVALLLTLFVLINVWKSP